MARPDVSNERKTQILNAAAAVFARHGFHQTRMDDIVQESGLSKGAIYWYFKSKDEIIIALVQQFFATEMHDLQTLLTSDLAPNDRIIGYVQRVASDAHQMNSIGLMPIFYECYALAMHQETVGQFLRSFFHLNRDMLADFFQQNTQQGAFHTSTEPSIIAQTFIAIIEGILLLWVIDPQSIDIEKQLFASTHIFIKGLEAQN